ncbi:MAG TPA: hypothetical protein VJL58_01980 [Pyrinomonadaceae bacterium]|nr:hypothetical protein [Pyrinomonadaceae bacterium]
MDELRTKYDVTPRDLARGRNLKIATWISPVLLTISPFILFLVLFFLLGSTPPAAATIFFLGLIATIIGFAIGIALSILFAVRHSRWSSEIRERMAADGIKANEIEWFRHELKPSEKRALREIEASDVMLADAYRDTLASRLTATRIVRSSKREMQHTDRRLNKLKNLKVDSAKSMQERIKQDADKIRSINAEAKVMLAEAESRLQMIEAAATRGGNLADSELALKKLASRASELPLALEEARLRTEAVEELEKEDRLKVNVK